MPRIPILRLGAGAELDPPRLASYTPSLPLERLQLGVDNLRHDVHLSPKFVEQTRWHVAKLIARHGNVDALLSAEIPDKPQTSHFISPKAQQKAKAEIEVADLKPLLTEVQVSSLNRAKTLDNISVDLMGRLAVIKFLRVELSTQFAQLLERCRMMLRSYEGLRAQKALEYRERVAAFEVAKKIILRKAGQDLFRVLREIEKETLSRMRRSLFGNRGEDQYKLFLNPLIFSEDGRDIYLNAEHYILFGNFDRDPDRFANLRRIVCDFVRLLELPGCENDAVLDAWLNVPENAEELLGSGRPDESSKGRSQKARLGAWLSLLEGEDVMAYIIASYEVIPLLAEYSPRINAQQLKNALISRDERARVENLIEHGKLSTEPLQQAAARVAGYRSGERSTLAVRFLRDLLRYHRDLRRLEVLNAALDSINLIGNQKLRELSAMNNTLYEILLGAEQKPTEDKILRHVVLKADVRDSTRLTRSLLERGLNPASYFSLNFYDPVNKLLAKYGASKVFIEGDAVILTILERESEPGLAVSRACLLAREMVEIVRGYNQLLGRAGLPPLEIGVGISYQNSAPMYLMDCEQRIMISDALNESDRLASCNKRVRKPMERLESPFCVYMFQPQGGGDSSEELMNYNLNGVRISEAAFQRLQQEISLEECLLDLPELWGTEKFRLYTATVPVGTEIFRRIVVRASRIPEINSADFSLRRWTDGKYYEVCSSPEVYSALEAKAAAGR